MLLRNILPVLFKVEKLNDRGMYVTKNCQCGLPMTEWSDLSWGASYYQVNMKCVPSGLYYVTIVTSVDIVDSQSNLNYGLIAIQGNRTQSLNQRIDFTDHVIATCNPACQNDGRCFDGVCYCQRPYQGTSCSSPNGVRSVLPFVGNFAPYSINYFRINPSAPDSTMITYSFYIFIYSPISQPLWDHFGSSISRF